MLVKLVTRFDIKATASACNHTLLPVEAAEIAHYQILLLHCKKKVRRFYGKIPGNHLPVHIPLFLRASACRTFLEIKKW